MNKAITVRQLLSHTSGVPNLSSEDHANPVATLSGIADPELRAQGLALLHRLVSGEPVLFPASLLVAAAQRNGLLFEPGTVHSYSNTGFMLLGMILEKVTAPWATGPPADP